MNTTLAIVAMIGALSMGGVACIGLAVRSWWRTVRRARAGCVADATVVELRPMGGSPDEPTVLTVFEFSDRRGVRHRARSKVASWPAPYAVGQRIRVSYEPDAPGRADIVQPAQSLVALGAFGLALALIAALMFWGLSNGGLRVS